MSWGRGCHCHYMGIDETGVSWGRGSRHFLGLIEIRCHGGGAVIVTVWGLMEHWGVMGEGLSLSLCGY